jgi:methionine sulfoxide reductase heme-binding subunit
MERRTLLLTLLIVIAMAGYLLFSSLMGETAVIWYQTRVFGLLSFVALFFTVVLGELRALAKNKAAVAPYFRYHKPLGIFAVTLVALHFVAAANDNFKWGKGLSILQYLGFSFGNKWLVLLSLGTLALYLMLLVALTSRTKAIQKIGYKNFRLIHYLSYLSFIIAYIHSVNLGTDIKTSVLGPFLAPMMLASFLFVMALLITRMLVGVNLFSDQWEVNLTATFLILLVIGGAFLSSTMLRQQTQVESAQGKAVLLTQELNASAERVQALDQSTQQLKAGGVNG